MRLKLTYALLFLAAFAFGQAPKLINYQGIVRGIDGAPALNQPISIRFQILKGSATGTVVYTEQQSLSTNSLGLIQTQIGMNSNLGAVVWNSSLHFLEVAIDITGGSNLEVLGTQQIMGVPYSFQANNVPASYSASTNILNIGDNTFTLSSTPPATLTGTGIASVTSANTNSFQVSVPAPSFTNAGPVQIIGTYPNYTLTSASPSISGTGNAVVTSPSTNSYVVNVPFMQITSTSSTGLSGVSGSGTNSVNINIPPAASTTLNGVGAVTIGPANVGNNFIITVPQTNVALTQTGTTAGISSSAINNFNINIPVPTISAAGLATVSTNGSSFNVGVAPLTYVNTTGVLSSGPNAVVVAPLLTFNNGTLTSGPSTNSVSLSSISPWRQGVGTVTLSTLTDRVGIGTSIPTENLQVESTTSGSISIISSNTNTSDLEFGTSANHGLGRLRYDNATGTLAFWTAGAIRASFNSAGQMVIGTANIFSTNTGLTVGRAGAINNQLMITGGDNSNGTAGILSLGENLNPTSGFSVKLDPFGNRLQITNDLAGNSPVVSIGGYAGSNNGMCIGTSYAGGSQAPLEGLAVQGFVGIGTTAPTSQLHVVGNTFIQGSSSILGNQSIQGSLNVLGQTTSQGNLTVGASAAAPADARVYGLVRMGREVNTTPTLVYPSSGMMMQRIFNANFGAANLNNVIASTDIMTVQRDGTNGGFTIVKTGTINPNATCQCSAITSAGLTLNKTLSSLSVGTTQLFLDTENAVFIRCMFGDPFGYNQHMTEFSISRYPGDYYWAGHMITTFNQ